MTTGIGTGEKEREARKLIAVDRDTGRMVPLEQEKKYSPKKVSEIEANREQVNKIIDHDKIIGAKLYYVSDDPYDKEMLFQKNSEALTHTRSISIKSLILSRRFFPDYLTLLNKIKTGGYSTQ